MPFLTSKFADSQPVAPPPGQLSVRLRQAGSAALIASSLALISCGSSLSPKASPPLPANPLSALLTAGQVNDIVVGAATSINVPLVIAVSDRRGKILAVYSNTGADPSAMVPGNFGTLARADDVAAALARTAAFFSNDQAPIGSRTVRFISGIHFPPGVMNVESAPLYGIENTNRGCGFNTTYLPNQSFEVPTLLHSNAPGLGILTGKPDLKDTDGFAVNPGGVPIFINNGSVDRVAGGIGVVAPTAVGTANYEAIVESAAVAATLGTVNSAMPGTTYAPLVPFPGAVVVNGITLPFVVFTSRPTGFTTGTATGSYDPVVGGPIASSGEAPDGDLITEHGSSSGGLTLAQVNTIVNDTIATGNMTRAAIRLPVGERARFVIAVSDMDGSLLALYRMKDATIFSVDVAVAKSRDVIWFSGDGYKDLPGVVQGTAITNRTLDFAGQPFYPGGIDGTPPGPFFPLFLNDVANPCTIGSQTKNAMNRSGIVFFPGSLPLYVNGTLVGGLGVSGDGVDQDDFATAGGGVGFEAPTAIRADRFFDRGVRLTYQKFPPNPTD